MGDIIRTEYSEIMQKSYIDYAMSVIIARALPDVRDGLKPVSYTHLNHLIYEIVDNSVDEHLAGFCDLIHVTLNKDGSATIEDNGRGVPDVYKRQHQRRLFP